MTYNDTFMQPSTIFPFIMFGGCFSCFFRPIQNAAPAAFAAPVLAEALERSLKVENYEG